MLSFNRIYIIIVSFIFLGILFYLNNVKSNIKINTKDNIEFDLLKDLQDINIDIDKKDDIINNINVCNDDYDENNEPKKYDIKE